jgi:FAD/FMN-containing dehydrogenase
MTADLRALQRAIDGDVVLPGAPDYESVRKPVMARFEHLRPAAVVRCATPADVAATLAVAGGLGLSTAIRSGGHSVAGRSSTDGVVLDVTPRARWRPSVPACGSATSTMRWPSMA